MLFVVAQDLPLFFVRPFLAGVNALWHLAFHFLQVLDPITRERDLLVLGRDRSPDVVLLAVERARIGIERFVLTLKILVMNCD